MKIKRLVFLLVMIAAVLMLASCGKKVDTDAVKNYSEPILENILQAGNKDDYAAYSRDFSDMMKEALTEKVFVEANKLIKDKIGSYQSKEFVKVTISKEKGINYVIAIYKANYSEEPKGVTVSVTFREDDPNHKVEGLFMTSPKLVSK